ncbi:hypothetical protein T484DRAFT_1816614 [Baffinella frigidus]|nr:hypothetical protein T484DRAFT_1816614 [Cryptophyta sp. CCMP2293]
MATEGMAVRELVDALEAREDLAAIPGVHNQLREKLTQDDVMSPLASSPELLSRLLGTLMKHAACSEEALSLEALSTLGALAHRKDVCSAFSGEQVKSLITLVVDTSQHTQSKPTAKLCLWLLSMQDFTAAQLNKVALSMINAAINGCNSAATREALSALERMLLQLPKHLAANLGGSNGEAGWLHAVLACTVSRTGKVRDLAQALVARSLALFHAADAAQRELATASIFARFKEAGGLLASLEAMAAGAKEFGKDKTALARSAVQAWGALAAAWGALAAVLDGRVVKSGLINQFLKVMGDSFSHPSPDVRAEAMAAWANLATLFNSMNSTIA